MVDCLMITLCGKSADTRRLGSDRARRQSPCQGWSTITSATVLLVDKSLATGGDLHLLRRLARALRVGMTSPSPSFVQSLHLGVLFQKVRTVELFILLHPDEYFLPSN